MLLEQYGRFKKAELEESPFRCLLDTNIEINPHQIIAFCAAIQALKTGGIVLADEVGLGKTIEAGLTLKYVLDSGAKRVLIALPATLRKQWEVELEEKFNLKTIILDRLTVESNLSFWKACLENRDEVRIVITSYDYSSKLMQRFSNVKWDFIIIDEAHNLRNVFHGTKRAKRLYELSKGIPKILLTATPLQNSLSDLHGLISFIDPRIFGSEKVFNKRFIEGQDYTELKRELIPVLYRTLRRDVGKYMDFKKRECRTIDFVLSPDEVELYMRVNNFLKKDVLYSIPNANKGLIVLVIRKLLASSSYALIETFEVLKNRLQKLYEGTKSANAQDGFDLFWNFVEDEIDESGFEEIDDEDTLFQKQQIQAEIDEVDAIIETASRIQSNAKIKALKTAIHTAFEYQEKLLNKILEETNGINKSDNENYYKREIFQQLCAYKNAVDSIENEIIYLFSCHSLVQTVDFLHEVSNKLLENTLAFYLATQEEKMLLRQIFDAIVSKIEGQIGNISKYTGTMISMEDADKIIEWIEHNNINTDKRIAKELLDLIENVFGEVYPSLNLKKGFALSWVRGDSYEQMNKDYEIKIHDIEKLCQYNVSYQMSFFVGNIIDLVDAECVNIDALNLLQQALRYGVNTKTEVSICEKIFNDRFLAKQMKDIIGNNGVSTDEIIKFVKSKKKEMLSLLSSYPSYFINVIENI